MEEKLWSGRFEDSTHPEVEAFTASHQTDRRLYPYDIAGSIAHCRMLGECGIIEPEEADAIIDGLGRIRDELNDGTFAFSDALEDIHMHIESRLTATIGPVALKLHTARSRNDQVALDVRLFLRDAVVTTMTRLLDLREALINLAEKHLDTVLPGYTHLQRAQPVLWAHHLLAYAQMFARDAHRLSDAYPRLNVLPLGSAALAGTPHPINRARTAELLGCHAVSANSMDSVSDRDFIMEYLGAASIGMIHLSRLSEELILWSSSEFGFIELPDAFATGSSIMPQKKNPDVPELIRGKSGRVVGSLMAVLTMMKSLPLAYNRDMQEDKPPLFDAVDTYSVSVRLMAELIPVIRAHANTMRQAATQGYLNATDLADYLAERGVPFRQAHECAGKAVAYGLKTGRELDALTVEELSGFSEQIGSDVFERLQVLPGINRRQSEGGTARNLVVDAIHEARALLAKERTQLPTPPVMDDIK